MTGILLPMVPGRRPLGRGGRWLAVTFAVSVWVAPTASAKAPPPPASGISGVAQYVETFPTSSGGRTGGPGGTGKVAGKLKHEIVLAGGTDSSALQKILASASSRAQRAAARNAQAGHHTVVEPARESPPSAASAFAASGIAFGRRAITVAAVLLVLTVGAVLLRRRRT